MDHPSGGNGSKLATLHTYWHSSAVSTFVDSSMATQKIGSAKNHELNCADYVKRCIAGDLTHFSGPELNTRVQQALQPP